MKKRRNEEELERSFMDLLERALTEEGPFVDDIETALEDLVEEGIVSKTVSGEDTHYGLTDDGQRLADRILSRGLSSL